MRKLHNNRFTKINKKHNFKTNTNKELDMIFGLSKGEQRIIDAMDARDKYLRYFDNPAINVDKIIADIDPITSKRSAQRPHKPSRTFPLPHKPSRTPKPSKNPRIPPRPPKPPKPPK